MPLIKLRPRGEQLVKHRTRLDRENKRPCMRMPTSWASRPSICSNQLIDTVVTRDKEFRSGAPNIRTDSCRVRGRAVGASGELAERHSLRLTHPEKYSARRSRGRSESKRFGRLFNRVRQWRSRWLPRPDCGSFGRFRFLGTMCSST
jgi:hypothetical protein